MFITQKKAASILGVCYQTLWHWRRKGLGPSYTRSPGGKVRYRYDDVIGWVEAHRVEPRQDPPGR
jgi:predicted site-specific integrase-resolvase